MGRGSGESLASVGRVSTLSDIASIPLCHDKQALSTDYIAHTNTEYIAHTHNYYIAHISTDQYPHNH